MGSLKEKDATSPASENAFEEGLTEKETKELLKITNRFMKSYSQKDKSVSDEVWLFAELKKELPERTDGDLTKMAKEIVDSVTEFDRNHAEINQACDGGMSKESWFANKVSEASVGMSVAEYGDYLNSIDTAITNSNAQVMRTVMTKTGEISQNQNLHGFIAEQYHVNTFNMQAALEKAPVHAEVCVPEPGQSYGRNSFDIVIRDNKTGRIVHQYQSKFGKGAKETLRLLKEGNYNNQREIVPTGQVEEVSNALQGKSVTDYIGGTEKVPTKSKPLSKEEAVRLQNAVQENGVIPKHDWNVYNTKELALNLGRNAGLVGIHAAILTTGFDMVSKVVQGENIDTNETVELALKSGADAGIKAAAAGALKVGTEKGMVALIPPGTPAGMIANIACFGIENAKILAKVASGEISMSEALDKMGRTSTSMLYGLKWGSSGMLIGAVALSCIPFVGPIVGGVVGGMAGYMAGSKFGEAVYTGVKKIGQAAKSAAKSVWNTVKSAGSKIGNAVKKIFGR